MVLDVTALAVFLALTFLGWRTGLISQAIRIGALVAVVAASPMVAAILRESMFGEVTVAEPVVEGFCLFLAGGVIYFGIALAGWLAVKTMHKASDTLSTADRMGGALVGAVKAGVIVYLLAFVVIFVERGLKKTDPDNHLRLQNAELTTWVKHNNVLAPWHLPGLNTVHEMVKVAHFARELNKSSVVRAHAAASDVLRRDGVKALLDDKVLVQAAVEDRFAETVADARVRDLMRDEEVMKAADAVDWAGLLAEIAPEQVKKPAETP
jgi:uncharacterized membrane protein required for colicin V production